jgi:ABC-2 type transport system permease protein
MQMITDILVCFRKDFMFYFRSYTIYVLMATYLLLSGILLFYVSDFYDNSTENLYQFFRLQPGIMALIIPALTMRLWADEAKNNTLELLTAQPISLHSIVLGKFFAVWAICSLILASSTWLWLGLNLWLPLDNWWILTNYAIVWLLCGLLCAVGCLASTVFYNAIGAFLLGLGLCAFCVNSWGTQLLPKLFSKGAVMLKLADAFDFGKMFDGLISGQIDPSSLGYFVVNTVAVLWIDIEVVKHKRF